MKIKIISWNIRGANDRDKRKVIKALIRSQRADLGVCLQETKIQDISRGIVHSLGVGRFLGWGAMSARGAADGFLWTFTGVYGPTIKRHRELFWEELGAIRGLWSDPWCIGGDFNVVRFLASASRVGRLTGSMRRFSEVIEELALKDLPLHGGLFTWSGGLNGLSRSRLDRFLISEDWENHFSGASQCSLPRPVSDHFPILLDGGGTRRGPIPFRFENMWLKEEGFQGVVEGLEQFRALNEQELEARKEAREEFKKWALMEETSWRQKSREIWLKEGDKKHGILPQDGKFEQKEELFEKKSRSMGLGFQKSMTSKGCDLNGDKAPGPDGFSLAFWQFCWEFVKYEVLGFSRSFMRGLLAKVLANRLKKVVGKVVSSSQNAFVEEKAYDRINWDFLLSVMQRMGFGEKWIGWIRWCISTASFSVLVNGSPTGFFRSSRGLRQGDPLSPYLFVLGMEALSSLINRAVRGGFLSGCRIGGREGVGIQVTHLLFADDTLVFCDDSQEQVAFLSWLLMWFEATSGLRINLNKSEILPVGCVENAELLAAELGCKVGSLPSTYLGLPLGASHKSVKFGTEWKSG
ncbi:LINE-1 retrotransposable element ORF2 protein [Vitis vinifera]|uniref:LINE-1 retrotransposable element ORF2 protein n=1 Tax=Vitis vinifera TaxID=29760 RepID=A0A438ETS5_VITVI|nr:LINE-1 retrotransposable element ORF2 protein [Vitis vinifera]